MATKRKRVNALLRPPPAPSVPPSGDAKEGSADRPSGIELSPKKGAKANGDGKKRRHGIPEADVRWLFETLLQGVDDPRLQRVVEAFGKLSQRTGLLQQLRKSDDAPKLLNQTLRDAVSGSPEDRVLAYPFTKGITTINEGMGFGEIIDLKVGKVVQGADGDKLKLYTVTSLRTRTGKLRLEPLPSAQPPGTAGMKGTAKP
jgi:hypothetical protein